MTILKKYWYIPLVIMVMAILAYLLFPNIDKIIKESEEKIQAIENEKIKIQADLDAKITVNKVLRKEKERIQAELDRELNKEPAVIFKPVEKIKKVVVENKVYVPVKEYDELSSECKKLYDGWERIKKKFSLYIKYDQGLEDNVTKIIEDYEGLREKDREVIDQLRRDRNKLARIAKRRWILAAGPGVSADFKGNLRFGLHLTLGYRIW